MYSFDPEGEKDHNLRHLIYLRISSDMLFYFILFALQAIFYYLGVDGLVCGLTVALPPHPHPPPPPNYAFMQRIHTRL
jgi:hypothetical protein